MQQLRVLPGVQAVSAVSSLPFSTGTSAGGIVIEGREEVAPRPGDIGPYAGFRWIASDYPSAIRMQLLKGRGLREQDNGNSVVVINQVMARRYWPDEDPVGRRVRPRFTDRWFEVVGVVSDLRHFTYDRDPDPEMFFPLAQSSTPGVWLLVRTAGKPTGMAEAIRNAVRTMDKTLPVDNVRTMDQRLSDSVAEPRFRTLLLAAFALLALTLAAVGVYGVMSHMVAQRTREIGVRMALGAQRCSVLAMVIGQGMKVTALGVAIGVCGSFGLTRVLKTFLFHVAPTDPSIFVLAGVVLAGVAVAACYIPARRAARIDPIVALRCE